MHFEILVEDESGKALLDHVVPRILPGNSHTWQVHHYRGLGHIPKGLRPKTDARHRILLDRLPSVLQGYGRSLDPALVAVVVVVDNDRRDCAEFLAQLHGVLESCDPKPRTLFRLAIAETEAWLLGDQSAVLRAYPKAKKSVLAQYRQDSISDTWEALADAVHPGGSSKLKEQPYHVIGRAKSEWADSIARHIDVESNGSPSFAKLRDGLRRLARSKR
ncbi:MAG: hypothetical protein U0Q16_10340 [Bryobacteraceae bacterium]